jgi:phosphopentomutase
MKKEYTQLMKESLNSRFSAKKRAKAFNSLYYLYVKNNGNDSGWDTLREDLRKRHLNELTKKQKKKFGLTDKEISSSSNELKKFVSTKSKSNYPVEIFYKTAWALIKKISNKNEKILDIGFGDYPIFIEFLDSKGYNSYGVEPSPKKTDNKKTFEGTINKFPKELEKEYNLILINMVYTINYTHHFSEKFEWELKNKKIVLEKLARLLKKEGKIILIDDIGTIFTKKELKEKLKVILFEKDIELDIGKGRKAFCKITLLSKL